MNTRFKLLFTLGISHNYYSTIPKDFDFLAPSETERVFRNRKLIPKLRDGMLYVLFEGDETGAALIPATGETIRIGLSLLNPSFFNFTDVPFAPGTAMALYRNSASPTQLDALRQITLVGNFLTHKLTDPARPATVRLLDSVGHPLVEETVTAENDRPQVTFDLNLYPAPRYSVQETFPGNVQKTAAYYRDAELLQERVFGIVEIVVNGSFYNAPPAFQISFAARQETLKYYVVAHTYSNTDLTQLNVADLGFTEESRPEITFTRVAAGDFTPADISPSLFGNSDTKVVLFKSQAAVTRSERARRKIQLNRNGKVLVEHMPQPGADQTTADLIIHVSKP